MHLRNAGVCRIRREGSREGKWRASVRAGLDSWSPNRLRHACATRVRAKFGISEAASVLGHMDPTKKITNVYSREAAEAEAIKGISPVMLRIG